MKKILLFCFIALGISQLSAQQKFTNYETTQELRKVYPTVKPTEKANYFYNYYKLAEIERLQKDKDFKKFDKSILRQLVEVMYNSQIDLKEINEVRSNAMKNLDVAFASNQNLSEENLTDLENIYNPDGIYSGLSVQDLGVSENEISFITTTGTAENNYYHFYKVKGNKLKHMKTLTHKQMQH